MSTSAAAGIQEQRTGLEDVVRSVRALARATRSVAEGAAQVAERELAMAITISEQLRDSVVSKETLEQARKEELPARLRQDAHRIVDLLADGASLAFVTSIRFVETFVDQPRDPIRSTTSG